MDILNSTSFGDMLGKCSDASGYRGVIVFNTERDLTDFIKEFIALDRQSAIPGLRIVKQNLRSGTIEFTNDSTIQLVLATTPERGRRCNTMLFAEGIDRETKDILSGSIIPYQTVQWEYNDKWVWEDNKWVRRFMGKRVPDDKSFEVDPMDSVTDTSELDSFLNGFAVNS